MAEYCSLETSKQTQINNIMTSMNDDWLLHESETSVILKHIEKNINQINRDYFEGIHGILSVTNNGDYVTVKSQEVFVGDYDTQKLFDALENFSEEDRDFLFPYNLWDYLDHCKHTPENQKSDNKLKPDKENDYQKCLDYLTSEKTLLNKWIKQLQDEYQELENIYEILREKNRELEQNQEYNQKWIDNLKQRVHDLECAIQLLQQENKRLTSNQLVKSELKPIEIQKEDQSIIDFRNTVKAIKTGISPKPVLEQVSKPKPNPTAKKNEPIY